MKKVATGILTALAVFGAVQTASAVFDTEQTATSGTAQVVSAAPGKHFPMYSKGR